MKRVKIILLRIIGLIIVIWILLTFYVELEGPKTHETYGKTDNYLKALIVYDPDPFYDLDKQICTTIAATLSENKWNSTVISVAADKNLTDEFYDLYVFCANTYNWEPDRVICNYIKNFKGLTNKNVVAITLGSGSTKRAQRIFEKLIIDSGANLVVSKSFWLMKPNDELKIETSNNVEVANHQVQTLVEKLIVDFNKEKF